MPSISTYQDKSESGPHKTSIPVLHRSAAGRRWHIASSPAIIDSTMGARLEEGVHSLLEASAVAAHRPRPVDNIVVLSKEKKPYVIEVQCYPAKGEHPRASHTDGIGKMATMIYEIVLSERTGLEQRYSAEEPSDADSDSADWHLEDTELLDPDIVLYSYCTPSPRLEWEEDETRDCHGKESDDRAE